MALQSVFNHALDNLGPFESRPHLALAVSGGSDSMALAFLAKKWCALHQGQITCLIMDHGLRLESSEEALNVQHYLMAHQLPCEILTWTGPKPKNRLQEQARRARYDLLTQWCYTHHVLHLLTGHHQDDQRETYQLRQDKNSAPLGLSGMSALIEKSQIRILRPLLTFSKLQLRTFLKDRNIFFVEDPSNMNPKFTRSTLRQHNLNDLEKTKIHQSCRLYGQQRIQEEIRTNDLICRCISLSPQGYGISNKTLYQNMSEEHQLGILQRCLMTFGIGQYPPSRLSLKDLNQRLQQVAIAPQTLHGCVIFSYKKQLYITREPAQIKSVSLSTSSGTLLWDERFEIKFSNVQKGDILAPLGPQGWAQLKQRHDFKNKTHRLKLLPAFVRFGLPSLWRENQCLYVWLLDENPEFIKTSEPSYSEFTIKEVCDIYFSPRYPLTRFTFVIV